MDLGNQTIVWPLVEPLVSLAALDMFLLVNDVGLCSTLSLFGIFTNLANIIVFIKMGFSETSNMNFLALSVFDLLVSVTALFSKLIYSSLLRGVDMGDTLSLVSGVISFTMFVVIGGSAMVTALISTERCLCIVFPLQMKRIITQSRVLCLLLLIVIYHAVFIILLFVGIRIPDNELILQLGVHYFSLYAIPSTTCFFIVLLTTIAMVVRLKRNLKWRRGTTQNRVKNTEKESKIAKTIIAISTIFIICFFPNVANFIAQVIYPAYSYGNPYLWSLITTVFSFSGVLQAISSSVNIFFYYRMSSRYKKVFRSLFSLRKKSGKEKPDRQAV